MLLQVKASELHRARLYLAPENPHPTWDRLTQQQRDNYTLLARVINDYADKQARHILKQKALKFKKQAKVAVPVSFDDTYTFIVAWEIKDFPRTLEIKLPVTREMVDLG